MVGYSGSGKTTYAKNLAEKKKATIFCSDEVIRANHKEGMTFRENIAAYNNQRLSAMRKAILTNRNLILDGNYLSVESRREAMALALFVRDKIKESLKDDPKMQKVLYTRYRTLLNVKFVVVHIDNEWEECSIHRVERDGCEWKIEKGTYDEKAVPTMAEGFYSIMTITNEYKSGRKVSE